MNKLNIARLVIAATQSGAGKTTIVSGILASLRAAGQIVQAYKIGPDYIDPGYHQLASGRPAHNLDTWLVPSAKLKEIFTKTAALTDIAIIEGVMGLYDGGRQGISSTAQIAKVLDAPVLLVIDVKSMGDSAAAIALGFKQYDPAVNLAGVILNRVGSKTHEQMIRAALAKLDIKVFGAIYRDESLALPERHLGLTPVSENDDISVIDNIRRAIEQQIDLIALCQLAAKAPNLACISQAMIAPVTSNIKIAVAQDQAFSFYYPESLQVLIDLRAQIIPFSPLNDAQLPAVDGMIIGGGFPEMFAAGLAANTSMCASIEAAGKAGMPIYAECGGLMYLTEELVDFTGTAYPMVGLIPAHCRMNKTLQTVGYIEAQAIRDNILSPRGTLMRGHEFHFSSLVVAKAAQEDFPWAFNFVKKRTGMQYLAGYAKANILASYLHLHFAGNESAAAHFVAQCHSYAKQQGREPN